MTNALGFRDHEFPTGRSADCRVMAIGDSFTFGWGVSLEESWPKALETALRHDGFGVDVANLGLPGASPVDYANIADRAIPILKPDLVIVGVLQGDDLRQMRDHRAPSGRGGWRHEVGQAVHRIEARLYPHLTLLMGLADDAIIIASARCRSTRRGRTRPSGAWPGWAPRRWPATASWTAPCGASSRPAT